MSAADRSRRYRAHQRGDHSLCDPSRPCRSGPPRDGSRDVTAGPPRDGATVAGPVEAELRVLLGELTFGPGDPRSVMSVVALRLAVAIDEAGGSPSAALARELRQCVGFLTEAPNEEPTVIDELRTRRHARRLELLLGSGA